MKTLRVLRELEKYPVFDMNIFRGVAEVKGSYAKLYLHRLAKSGMIFKIERNRYTIHKNPFLIASRIAWPSYISLWSALRFYNLTEQIPHAISVVTAKKRNQSAINFCGTKIVFTHIDKKYFSGYKKINYEGHEVFIAEPEKALVDALLLKKISDGEALEILKKNKKEIDFKKFLAFSRKAGREFYEYSKAFCKKSGVRL